MANSAVVGILKAMLTADTSQFDAGMRKASTTAQQTEKTIGGLGKEVTKLTPQAERMVKAFGGDKLLYQANSLAASIAKIGGAAKLTNAEQVKVNATVTQAIAKYQSLGKEAPAALLALQRETKAQVGLLEAFKSALGPIGPALVAAFSVRAVIGAAKSVVDFAGDINDLSAETGVAVERIQALNYIGAGANVTFADMARGIEQLASRLDGDDKSANAALLRLGIHLDEIKSESPDQLFIRIGQAVASIRDPLERIRILRDLFGRQGPLFGRVFTEDMEDVVKQVEKTGPVLKKELIDKADEFGDAWDRAIIRTKAGLAAFFTGFSARNFTTSGDEAFLPPEPDTLPSLPGSPTLARPGGAVSRAATDAEIARLERQSKAILEAIKHAEALRQVTASLWGRDVVERATLYAEALGKIGNLSRLTAEKKQELRQAVLAALDVYKALGTTAPEILTRIAEETGKLGEKSGDLAMAMRAVADEIHGMDSAATIAAAGGMDALYNATVRAKEAQDRLAKGGFITPQFEIESEDITEEVRHFEHDMSDLAEAIRRDFMQMSQAVSDSFGDMLVGARSFQDGMLDIWRSIQRGIANILGDILNDFIQNFLKGMLKAIAESRLGEALGRALVPTGGGPGGGGNPLSQLPSMLPLFMNRGGPGSAPPFAVPPSAFGPLAGAFVGANVGVRKGKTWGALSGAGSGALVGLAFGGPVGAAVGAAVGAIAGFVGGLFHKNKNDLGTISRQFFEQFVPYGGIAGAFMQARVRPDIAGSLIQQLLGAHDTTSFRSLERRAVNLMAIGGLHGLKSFEFGGFTPPNTTQLALVHGGSMGELHLPVKQLAQMNAGRPSLVVHVTNHISGIDGPSITRVVESPSFTRSLGRVIRHNIGYLATDMKDALT